MGRPPNPELTKAWKIIIDATLAGQIEFLLLDPLTAKPKHGARKELIEQLLREWLAKKQATPTLNPAYQEVTSNA